MGLFDTMAKSIAEAAGMSEAEIAEAEAQAKQKAADEAAKAEETAKAEALAQDAEPTIYVGALNRVDVAAELEKLKAESKEDLDWRRSIVDLMKLTGLDSSYSNRKQMAIELGYPEGDIESRGSAEMNMWLHKKVLQQLAYQGLGDGDQLMA